MVDAGHFHDLDGRRVLAFPRERLELVGVLGLDLRIELALHDEQRLPHVLHKLRRIAHEQALELRVVDAASHVRRQQLQPLPGHHRLMDFLLRVHLRLLLLGRQLHAAQQPLLLREHDVGAGDSRRGDQADGPDALVLCRGHQRDEPAFAVADRGDALRIHVLPVRQHLDRRAHILRVIGQRGRLGAAAALPDAALVVTDDDETGVGEGSGDLAENRDAEHDAVAIGRSAAADQHDGGQTRGARLRRPRQRADEGESIARNIHLLVVRPRDGHAARRDRGDVLPHDFERLRGDAEPDHPAGVIGPEIRIDLSGRQHQRDVRAPRRNHSCRRLNLFAG